MERKGSVECENEVCRGSPQLVQYVTGKQVVVNKKNIVGHAVTVMSCIANPFKNVLKKSIILSRIVTHSKNNRFIVYSAFHYKDNFKYALKIIHLGFWQ